MARVDTIPESPQSGRQRLEQEFSGKIIILPAGGFLYHRSRSPVTLTNAGFNPKRSHADGAFYFSDQRSTRSNVAVVIGQDLILFNYNLMSDQELEHLERLGNGNFWSGLVRRGFDGRSFHTADPYVEIEDGAHANEVVVFRGSLAKLGMIEQLK